MVDQKTRTHGTIVAFEGQPDTVLTQLRLLPTSPHILTLPPIQHCYPLDDLEQDFEPRSYIRHVHDALHIRNEAAKEFFQSSAGKIERLVFMHGGTASAQSLCIKAIMKHETNGDRGHAEAIFNHLIKEGYAALAKREKGWGMMGAFESKKHQEQVGSEIQDPITRAMRAADALDRQTASLQVYNELDLTISNRHRSSSLPLYGYSDNFGDAAPFFVFGASQEDQRGAGLDEREQHTTAPMTPTFAFTSHDGKSRPSSQSWIASLSSLPTSPNRYDESYSAATHQPKTEGEALSPNSDVFSIRALDNVVYGEASLLDMRLSMSRNSLTRVKSLDRIYPASPKFRDLCTPSSSQEIEPETPTQNRPPSCMRVADGNDPSTGRLDYIDRPRTIVVRSKPPTISLAPVPNDRKKCKDKQVQGNVSYVDRGTDAEAAYSRDVDFQPVLPFTENFVVHFRGQTHDKLLESIIEAFKEGRFPLSPQSTTTSETDDANSSQPGTPRSTTNHRATAVKDFSVKPPVTSAISSVEEEDYDPFAYTQHPWPAPKAMQSAPPVTVLRPPTPARTPPPLTAEGQATFHEFSVAPNQTAVAVQNSLRSILAVHFPPEPTGQHQFHFSLLPELDGLWQPVFRGLQSGTCSEEGTKLDQMLAIGSQKGVNKEYSSAIIAQLEKHGAKSSGLGRTGRLDFRYLLANAMQAYTAQPLASQTSENPFANSYLLATLIIPHLERYLALHAGIRFLLLEYPPAHLPTVLALQKLVGVDLVKVTQIVDPSGKEASAFTHMRGTSISNVSDATFGKPGAPSPRTSSSDMCASRTNLLLTSTASDREIANFVSLVWNIPTETGESGSPAKPHQKLAKKKSKPAPLQGVLSPFPKMGPQSPLSPMAMTASSGMSSPAPLSPRPPSNNETAKKTKSLKSKPSRSRQTLGGQSPSPQVGKSSEAELEPSEESDCDAEERRLMPMFMHKPDVATGNSRKALKFLGLA